MHVCSLNLFFLILGLFFADCKQKRFLGDVLGIPMLYAYYSLTRVLPVVSLFASKEAKIYKKDLTPLHMLVEFCYVGVCM